MRPNDTSNNRPDQPVAQQTVVPNQQQHNAQPGQQQHQAVPPQQEQQPVAHLPQSHSNVVDIDSVEVTPIDDPFYDPNDPLSHTRSSAQDAAAAAAAAALREDSNAPAGGQQQPASNEVPLDDVDFGGFRSLVEDEADAGAAANAGSSQPPAPAPAAAAAATQLHQQQLQQQAGAGVPRMLLGGRPVGDSSMPDFPSGGLDLIQHLNLDGIMLENKVTITHDGKGPPVAVPKQQRQQQQLPGAAADASSSSRRHQRDSQSKQQSLQQQPAQRQRQQRQQDAKPSSSRERSSRSGRQQQQPQPQASQPRPHPFYVKPKHVKKHFKVTTVDGWKLHLVRTQVVNMPATQHHPIIMCPGLGSSGAYSFDLSPNVSLADFLAGKGWDVWTCELRGNGLSDKPQLFSSRGTQWTIDDYVEKDIPAIIRFVLKESKAPQVHVLGHSMGGMILCGVLARVDITTAKIRSVVCMGSGLFLEDSWWRLFDRFRFMLNALWVVPSGSMLRAYSRFMFGPYRIPYIDALYFWDSNVDHRLGRAMMSRNFSNISVGVIKQMTTAFGPKGLLSSDHKMVYADATRLAKVTAPALFLVGDRDRMCPPEGVKRTWQMLGSQDKRYICLGPASGFADHYGHFDILMGRHVESEVFPLIHQFLLQHDSLKSRL